jgi:phage gp36-like protein
VAYNSASTYASLDDLKMRLTDNGYRNLADRDSDGQVTTRDTEIMQEAIENANQIIDGYIQTRVSPDTARGSGNVWLRDRCVDLACYRVASLGGRQIPETFILVNDEAMRMLREVGRGTMQVPRMEYPYNPPTGTRTQRVPRSFNFGRNGRGRRA